MKAQCSKGMKTSFFISKVLDIASYMVLKVYEFTFQF